MTRAAEQTQTLDSVFTWGGGSLKFGEGAIDEIGADVAALGLRRVVVITDSDVAAAGHPERVRRSLVAAGVESYLYADVEVEPTDASIRSALSDLAEHEFEGIIAVGGGSVLDTAKAVNLIRSAGGELLDYVNQPVGRGLRADVRLLPFVAVPTTAGSGSESTGVCVMDLVSHGVKSGISDWKLRATLAVIDPTTTLSLPLPATISSGLDVLCHNLESLTSRAFDQRPRPTAGQRPTFSGANPFSDLLCEQSMELLAGGLRRVVRDGSDRQARNDVMLASTLTAVGSSTAGVHIPHACSYAIAAQVKEYRPAGSAVRRPFVPHGVAVAATILATLEMTYESAPEQHLRLAGILARHDTEIDIDRLPASERLVTLVSRLLDDLGADVELAHFGFTSNDVGSLVDGTMLQERLLAGAPQPVGRDLLKEILTRSIGRISVSP